ncbi:MAG: hypothetical protein F6K00_19625 [Leptolyngbya sp. SIOISBB]|nr:hypothetical protein [Leptolyngbya sp. SIOISBB]
MNPAQYNLLIPQGTDYALTLTLTEGPSFRTTGAAVGASSIPLVAPLRTALATGDKVNFEGAIATLAAPATVGTKTLTVEPLGFKLERVTGEKCLNLTGFTAIAPIYRNLSEASIAQLTADVDTAPTEGKLILTMANATSGPLPSTTSEFLTEAELQAITEQGSHYIWQLHLTDTNSLILRPVEGFVVVSQKGA